MHLMYETSGWLTFLAHAQSAVDSNFCAACIRPDPQDVCRDKIESIIWPLLCHSDLCFFSVYLLQCAFVLCFHLVPTKMAQCCLIYYTLSHLFL